MWREESALTYRRVRVLLDRLPGESLTKTAMRNTMTDEELAAYAKQNKGQPHGPWSNVEFLLAQVIDGLAMNEYAIYRSQGGKPRKPDFFPRPGVVNKATQTKPGGKPAQVDLGALQQLRIRPKE